MQSSGWEDLLQYYNRELTYLRKAGSEFAKRYPKIANRLELSSSQSADPNVERLIESFAFLTARIQHDIESEFPEITSAMLGVLYPQFLNPVPSMAIARFEVDPKQGKLTAGYTVPKDTALFAQTPTGLTCHFRTSFPVTLWPLEVTYAGFASTDQFDFLDSAGDVATVLRIRVESRQGGLQEQEFTSLRFHLGGEQMTAFRLYEMLFGHVISAAILPDGSRNPITLPNDALKPVGFEPGDDVLPYPPQAHAGYRLIQEYFTFPEKFLFFDVNYLDRRASNASFDILLMFDSTTRQRLSVDRETFLLGCTPIINLFRKTAEPIRLDHRKTEYALNPDTRRERSTEIHSILRVSASSNAEEETKTFEPFHSIHHHAEMSDHKAFWHARRLPAVRKDLPGTEMFLSMVDLDFKPSLPPSQTVFAHTLCTNRHLAQELPAGAQLQIEEAAPAARISCLHKPTRQLDPPLGGSTLWELVSQLSLNHLSLAEGREGLKALREILRLYSFLDHAAVNQQIQGIREMQCRPVVRRVGGEAWRGFCRGMEVSLLFDEELYVGSSAFLFASVLNRFFALYASVNSFTQLAIQSKQREGEWKRWQPIAGEQIVL